jgi:hypothetical protein
MKYNSREDFRLNEQRKRFGRPFLCCVTRPGFEPRQAESESAVLPLYYRAIFRKCKLKEKINNRF